VSDDLIEDPVFRYRLRLSREDELLRGEFWVEPGGGGKVEHYHPSVEERFQVLAGEIAYRADGRRHVAGPDSRFTIPAGVRHSFTNTGNETAHFLVEMEPALQMEELFRDAAALGRDGKWMAIGRRGVPTGPRAMLAMAEFLDRYREIFVPTSPPRPLQRIAVPPLARLARRRRRSP
jgi:quercetin dioxygenase-like cupin family protein